MVDGNTWSWRAVLQGEEGALSVSLNIYDVVAARIYSYSETELDDRPDNCLIHYEVRYEDENERHVKVGSMSLLSDDVWDLLRTSIMLRHFCITEDTRQALADPEVDYVHNAQWTMAVAFLRCDLSMHARGNNKRRRGKRFVSIDFPRDNELHSVIDRFVITATPQMIASFANELHTAYDTLMIFQEDPT